MVEVKSVKPKGLALLKAALSRRKSACMLAFGFTSGLPFALLIGTVNAWLGEVGITLATIGVFSWIGLAYSFKFLWSPLVDRWRLPGLDRLGRRKGWIVLCQAVLLAALIGLALTNPRLAIGPFATLAFIAALASATQDVAIDAWRIEAADEASPVELLAAIYQFGYRTASIFGGAFALMLAARMSWNAVFLVMAGVFAVAALLSQSAQDTPREPTHRLHLELGQPGELAPATRAGLLFVVMASWTWAVISVVAFMGKVLAPVAPGGKPPSVAEFTKGQGPWIIAATVAVPLVVAALGNGLRHAGVGVLNEAEAPPRGLRPAANHVYSALVSPFAELSARLGWGVLSLLGVILTYAVAYNIWASFAFPFYLNALHYSKDEVAFASKIFGIVMTMVGISLCGYLFARIGRFPTVMLGAILPPTGNLVYADLAEGGHGLDAVSHLLRLDALATSLGSNERMVRLLLAICYENISVGIALTALVAYVSGMVSKRYTAIQFALLSSLVSLIGTLGRGVAGEAFGLYGYAPVFRWTALTGVVAVVFVGIEWARVSRAAPD